MVGRINNKKILEDNSSSIQKSNEFSMVKMNQGLTLNQMQLLSYAIYATQKDGTTTFRKIDFENKFNIEYKAKHAQEDSLKIIDLKVSTENLANDRFSYWNVFGGMEYDNGKFDFEWNPRMIPHILGLKDKYVLTDLTVTSQFKSSFSWTLYDYLKANYGCWYVNVSKDTLMNLFGVETKESYKKNTSLFKKKVLDIAIKEINTFTEIDISYDEVKKGRSIFGFTLKWSTGKGVLKASKKQIDMLKNIADTVLDDVLMYAEINDKQNRERALQIIRDFQSMKYRYLDKQVGLTSDLYNKLMKKAIDNLKALNSLLELEGKEPINTKVPLLNWLEKKT